MHAIAHGGCTETVRESALEVDSGRKKFLPHRGLEPASVLRLVFQSDALPTKPFPPLELPVVGLFLWVDGLDGRPAAPRRRADQHCLAYQRFAKEGPGTTWCPWLAVRKGGEIYHGRIHYLWALTSFSKFILKTVKCRIKVTGDFKNSSLSLSLSLTHTHTHMYTHARTRTHTHARTHAHAHTYAHKHLYVYKKMFLTVVT